jgi:hypothetical protein
MAGWKRKVISHHEAGHAVVARMLGIGVVHASSRSGAQALTQSAAWQSKGADTASQNAAYENDAIVALAGLAAQRRYQGTEGRYSDSLRDDDDDIQNARAAIYRAVCLRTGHPVAAESGMVTMLPETWVAMTERFDHLQAESRRLVAMYWPAIQRVAKALEWHDRIDQAELDRLIAVASGRQYGHTADTKSRLKRSLDRSTITC